MPKTPSVEKDRSVIIDVAKIAFEDLAKTLRPVSRLTELNVSSSNIDSKNCDECLSLIAQLLNRRQRLLRLTITNNSIGIEGNKAIAEFLLATPILSLNLIRNRIDNPGFITLTTAIETQKTLTSLSLSRSHIDEEGIIALVQALLDDKKLLFLSLDYIEFKSQSAAALVTLVERHPALIQLDLAATNFDTQSKTSLAKALTRNTSLTQLTFGNNNLGDEDAIAFAAALEWNNALLRLVLTNTLGTSAGIGAVGAIALARALRRNSTLVRLSLDRHYIEDRGATALAGALERNNTLQVLHLRNNDIDKAGAAAFANVFDRNTTLRELTINDNRFNDMALVKEAANILANKTRMDEAVINLFKAADFAIDYKSEHSIETSLARNTRLVTAAKSPAIKTIIIILKPYFHPGSKRPPFPLEIMRSILKKNSIYDAIETERIILHVISLLESLEEEKKQSAQPIGRDWILRHSRYGFFHLHTVQPAPVILAPGASQSPVLAP